MYYLDIASYMCNVYIQDIFRPPAYITFYGSFKSSFGPKLYIIELYIQDGPSVVQKFFFGLLTPAGTRKYPMYVPRFFVVSSYTLATSILHTTNMYIGIRAMLQ